MTFENREARSKCLIFHTLNPPLLLTSWKVYNAVEREAQLELKTQLSFRCRQDVSCKCAEQRKFSQNLNHKNVWLFLTGGW